MVERRKKKKEIAEDDLLRRLFTESVRAAAEEMEIKLTTKERASLVTSLIESHGDAIVHVAFSAADLALSLMAEEASDEDDEDEDEDEE